MCEQAQEDVHVEWPRMVHRASKTHSLPWAKSMPTLVSPARTWGGLELMAEGNPHRTIPQKLALRRRQFVHARAVLLHDQGARGLLFDDFPSNFHCLSIAPPRTIVNGNESPSATSG
jgi:hypothetical protein